MNENIDNERNRLHKIIWNMSKSDKAYLKKYSKIFITKGETKHKIYYAIIDKMENYSSEKLKQKLEKHGGYRRFKNTEQEIYSQILEDLIILKAKKRPTWNYLLEHIKSGYLFLNGNFDESLKHYETLYRIKEEAKNGTIDYMYYKFYYHTLNVTNVVKKIKEVDKIKNVELELRQSIENLKLQFLTEAAIHNLDIFRFSSFNNTRVQFLENIKPFKKEYIDVLPKQLVTNRWKMLGLYYHCFCQFYLSIADFKNLDLYTGLQYHAFENKEVKDNFHHDYVNSVGLRIEYLAITKNPEAFELLDKLKKYIKENNSFVLKSYFYTYYTELSLLTFNNLNDLPRLKEFIKNEKKKDLSTTRFALETDLLWAISFFKLKNFKEVQPYLDKIFNVIGEISAVYNKVLVSARVLDILIHFELKNYENLPYYITNLEKEMKRNDQLLPFDMGLFSNLKKISQQLFSKHKLEKEVFFKFLKNNKDQDRMESYLTNLDIELWLEKLDNN